MNQFLAFLKSLVKRVYYKAVPVNVRALEYSTPPKPMDLVPDRRIGVLFILPYLNVGGVERVTLNLLSGLDRQKFRKYVITTENSTHPMEADFRSVTDGLLHLGKCSDIGKLDKLSQFIGLHHIHVIHIQHSKIAYRALRSMKLLFPQLIAIDTLHMEEPDQPWDYVRYSNVFRDYLDHRVVITARLKESLDSVYGENARRVTVVENGLDCSKYKCQPNTTAPDTVVFIGRLVNQKQPLQFVKIASKLHDIMPDMRFIMIGGGPLQKKTTRMAQVLGLSEHLRIYGEVLHIPGILMDVTGILVAPSLREGLPVVGIEAMCMGFPVVAANVDGWRDLIESGVDGTLVNGSDVEQYVAEICRLVEDGDHYASIRRQAREMALTRFDLQRMCRAYESIYTMYVPR